MMATLMIRTSYSEEALRILSKIMCKYNNGTDLTNYISNVLIDLMTGQFKNIYNPMFEQNVDVDEEMKKAGEENWQPWNADLSNSIQLEVNDEIIDAYPNLLAEFSSTLDSFSFWKMSRIYDYIIYCLTVPQGPISFPFDERTIDAIVNIQAKIAQKKLLNSK